MKWSVSEKDQENLPVPRKFIGWPWASQILSYTKSCVAEMEGGGQLGHILYRPQYSQGWKKDKRANFPKFYMYFWRENILANSLAAHPFLLYYSSWKPNCCVSGQTVNFQSRFTIPFPCFVVNICRLIANPFRLNSGLKGSFLIATKTSSHLNLYYHGNFRWEKEDLYLVKC